MAVEKYATEGIVIALYESGEHDMNIKVFTRDFGLVNVRAVSLRRSVKMRSHIMAARVCVVTLVKSKEHYRLVGVFETNKKHESLRYIRESIARYVHGEQKHESLYDRLLEYTKLENYDINLLRLCINLDILIKLGYLDIERVNLTKDEYINSDINYFCLRVSTNKATCVRELSSAIKSSML